MLQKRQYTAAPAIFITPVFIIFCTKKAAKF